MSDRRERFIRSPRCWRWKLTAKRWASSRKAAKEHNPELIRFTLQRLAFAGEKHLFALLGEGADVEILVQIKLAQGLHHGRELALAAVNHHHIGPVVEAVGLQSAAAFVTQGTHIHPLPPWPGPSAENDGA